jgi:SAM-dependent methyltransferase
MTWSPLAPNTFNETPKTRWRAVPWTPGKGLDVGCGKERLFETEFVIGIDNGSGADQFGLTVQANIRADAQELPFASGYWDFVYSSFMLQYIEHKDVPHILREFFRVLKPGGTVVLYLPDADQVPKVAEPELGILAEPGAQPGQQWNCTYDRVIAAAEKVAFNWDCIWVEKCDKNDEYALFIVFRKLK